MRPTKEKPMYCLRVYLNDKKQKSLIESAAKIAQKTSDPNISQFVRDIMLAESQRIRSEAGIITAHTKQTLNARIEEGRQSA